MKISIIIPTLNRPEQMIRLFERLNLVVTNEEIIVVDDSKESSEEELRTAAEFDLTYIHRGVKLGVSSARNFGAEKAKGEYLLFFDDDDDFTPDWITDFAKSLIEEPDIIQCEMKFVYPNKSEALISLNFQPWKLVIPGAWMIKKSFFKKIGGFDERLKFAENTDLFIRINANNPRRSFIPKVNFIYNQSNDGGSKNLQNMIDSNTIILEKHRNHLTSNTKHLYHQVIGVNQMRFRRFSQARHHLWQAYILKPSKIPTLGRFVISCFPFLAKLLYTTEVKLK